MLKGRSICPTFLRYIYASFSLNSLSSLDSLFLMNTIANVSPINTNTLATKNDTFIPFISANLDDILDTFFKDTLDIIVIYLS